MIAFGGGYEITLKRRVTFLKEVDNPWSPRFGVDHTIGIYLDRLLEYHGASSCTLVLQRPAHTASVLLYSASPRKPGRLAVPSEIPEMTARQLLGLPETLAITYHDPAGSGGRGSVGSIAHDPATDSRNDASLDACKNIANLLDASTFITVPYSQRDGTVGRIFLTAEATTFMQSDIEFLSQAAATISAVVEKMQLTDEQVLKAAEHERLKISRDMHDTTIQAYIGLKLGLDALYRQTGGEGALASQLGELIEMANITIHDLRAYAANLRAKSPLPDDFLVSAVNKQAERYRRFYGIDIEVKIDVNGQINGELARESFQIISEGLSNVLRHTSARRAFVHVLREKGNLLLKIGNEAPHSPGTVADFVAWSIKERAGELGGSTFTERGVNGYTVVNVTIPL
jgi:signal transduction histidine kinase